MYGAAMILEHDGRVLLLQRSPSMDWMPRCWNLPGGHVEPGETTKRAAIRETFEETHITVEDCELFTRTRYAGYTIDVFYATAWSGRVQLNPENTQFVWLARERCADADLIPPQATVLARFARSG